MDLNTIGVVIGIIVMLGVGAAYIYNIYKARNLCKVKFEKAGASRELKYQLNQSCVEVCRARENATQGIHLSNLSGIK